MHGMEKKVTELYGMLKTAEAYIMQGGTSQVLIDGAGHILDHEEVLVEEKAKVKRRPHAGSKFQRRPSD